MEVEAVLQGAYCLLGIHEPMRLGSEARCSRKSNHRAADSPTRDLVAAEI